SARCCHPLAWSLDRARHSLTESGLKGRGVMQTTRNHNGAKALLITSGFIAAWALSQSSVSARQFPGDSPKENARPAAKELLPQTFKQLHAMIRPQKGEAGWGKIPWFATLHEARTKAAAEAKPLFIWSASADP